MSEPMDKLKEFVNRELGHNTDNWADDLMFVDATINSLKNMQNNLAMFHQDHKELKDNHKNLTERYIELRNMVAQWNNDFYVHVYGELPPQQTEDE